MKAAYLGRWKGLCVLGLPGVQSFACMQTFDAVIDDRCPQQKPFEVVRCIAHQHVGSQVRARFGIVGNPDRLLNCLHSPLPADRMYSAEH